MAAYEFFAYEMVDIGVSGFEPSIHIQHDINTKAVFNLRIAVVCDG